MLSPRKGYVQRSRLIIELAMSRVPRSGAGHGHVYRLLAWLFVAQSRRFEQEGGEGPLVGASLRGV
jgi:hypothetical protein